MGTAHNYFDEMRVLFSKHVMLRLLHPRSGAEIDTWSSDDVKRDLSGAKIIFDLTAFPWSSKENVCWRECCTRRTTTATRAELFSVSSIQPRGFVLLVVLKLIVRYRCDDEWFVCLSVQTFWGHVGGGYDHL